MSPECEARPWVFLACLVLGGCVSTGTSPNGCPQPPQPTCVERTTAWCAAAMLVGTAEALPDAGVLVPCSYPPSGNRLFAVFDGGTLDDGGVPSGCPSLSTIPNDLSKSVVDAGTQDGGACCYPTRVYCQ
jgi:hypothetical protein